MITSKEIEHNYIEIGYNKCYMNIAKCFILAILAGMFIAFGGLSSSVASCMIENSSLAQNIVDIATKKCEIGFGDAIIRGILCNVLVCSAVWMSMTTKSAAGKIVALFMPIMVFVISGFEHSVANMFYIPAGIMALKEYGVEAEGLNWFNFFITNELPVTIGNLIGGISLSVALWFTQSQKAKK